VNILLWHVHGSYTTALVRGTHTYYLPTTPDRGPDGRGRAATWAWPVNVNEVAPSEMPTLDVDVVLLQRPHEYQLAHRWLGRLPGVDIAAVYLEHNAPDGDVPLEIHPMSEHPEIPIVHVSHFNRTFWDNGGTETFVIEHGITDPGARWTGEITRAGVVVNDPVPRWRVTGTDLLPRFAGAAPLDVFGTNVTALPDRLGLPLEALRVHEDLPQSRMHDELARRRVYLHPYRWTSLGLALIEAMQLGMPVVALATTEVTRAVPPEAGAISTSVGELCHALRRLLRDRAAACAAGHAAREAALRRYSLKRFLDDWDQVFDEVLL
jgi:hypothetical protein